MPNLLGEWSNLQFTRPRRVETWSKLQFTRPIGSESGIIYILLVRAGLREGVAGITHWYSEVCGGVVCYTSGFRRHDNESGASNMGAPLFMN